MAEPNETITPPTPSKAPNASGDRVKRGLIRTAEIALVIAIAGLLLAIWLPALIGAHPGTMR